MMCGTRIVRPHVLACMDKGRGLCSTECYQMWLDVRLLCGQSYRVMATTFELQRVVFIRPIKDKRRSPMGDAAPLWYCIA